MKIYLFYGPAEANKRGAALKIKNQFLPEVVTVLDLKQSSEKDLQSALSAISLFETKRLVVAENAPETLDLKNFSLAGEINLLVLASSLRANSKLLESAKALKAQINLFEEEQEVLVFPFLDELIERKKTAFPKLEQLLAEYEGIYILTMIYYLLRRNFLPPPASTFIRRKIESQKQKYDLENWQNFYHLTLEAEAKIKSGALTERLSLTRLVASIVGKGLE